MKTIGLGYCWEELEVGMRVRTLRRTITEADLVAFVSVTGMLEAIFIDATYDSAAGAIRGRFVPGALVYTFIEGFQCQSFFQGTGLALLEVHQRVLKPTFVGDTIHAEIEVTGVRPTSKGARAIVNSSHEVLNQRGECVLTYTATRMMAGRAERDRISDARAPGPQSE